MAKIAEPSSSTLINHWRREPSLTTLPPATSQEIREFESRHHIKFPLDLRGYFLTVNGFGPPNDQDRNGFSFWPLASLVAVSVFDGGRFAFPGAHECFLFADYLGWSWAYAIRLNSAGAVTPVCIVGTADGQPIWIADSFSEFVTLYVTDAPSLYSGGALDSG